jgi:hypothetical protein
MAPTRERNSILSVIMPTDGTRAAYVGTGDFGTSPIFVQLSDKQHTCQYAYYVERRNVKHNGGSRKNTDPIR